MNRWSVAIGILMWAGGDLSALTHRCVHQQSCVPAGSRHRATFTLKDTFGNLSQFEGQQAWSPNQCEQKLSLALARLSPCSPRWEKAASKQSRHHSRLGAELRKAIRVITVSPETLQGAGAKYDGKRIYGLRRVWTQFFEKIRRAQPKAVFLDYQFARRQSHRDEAERGLIRALARLNQEAKFPLFSCTPWGEAGDPKLSAQFRWGSCAVDLVTVANDRPSRVTRYCAHGPSQRLTEPTPFLLSGREFLKQPSHCEPHHRPVAVNLLESLGFAVPPELFQRTQVQLGEQVYLGLAVPRQRTRPHWEMGEVVAKGFQESALKDKILLVGDAIPGNDEHQLEGKPIYGLYNHVNLLNALLSPKVYASTRTVATPVSLASQPSQSRLSPFEGGDP